ncbi:MAG: tol-pal system protein YbgF [Nitrospirota bacterium]
MKWFHVLLLLFVSACVTSADFERLRQDVNGLKRETYDAKKDIDALKEKSAVAVKEDSFSAVRESQAQMNMRLSEISMSLQELRGRFEENKYFLEKSLKDSAIERDVIRAQIANIENQMKLLSEKLMPADAQGKIQEPPKEPASSGADSVQPEKTEQATDKKEDDRTKAYETAYQAFKDKKFKEARESFGSFIKNFPKNELTDNAQFWIAETYYSENDYEGAILAYETLLKKYPDSEKTSGALLKQGFAFIEIGDKKTGKIILERLAEKFPDSKETEYAKKKLAEIDKKPVKKK